MAKVVGISLAPVRRRAALTLVVGAALLAPLAGPSVAYGALPEQDARTPRAVRADVGSDRPAAPPLKGFVDDATKIAFDPPVGWERGPATSLNPVTDPPDPVQEIVRFQLRVVDPTLYLQPLPLTSALIRDAGAAISIGLARAGGELMDLEVDPRAERSDVTPVAGFYLVTEERTYEGLHVLTRYYVARDTDRRIIARAVTTEDEWPALAPIVRAALDSLRADPDGPNAPAAPAPVPVVAAPAPAQPLTVDEPRPDPSFAFRAAVLVRAAALLGTPYVWGGNSPGRGMDCSAFVSAAWGVARYTTDSIGWVSAPIAKEDLRPGDAMNLTVGRDPEGFGHIRMFEAWANAAHTLVWVYEETPPRAVHRVVVYDDRYQPIRLDGLSGAGAAPLVPAPAPAPERGPAPAAPRPSWGSAPTGRSTPRPQRATPTPRQTIPAELPPIFGPGTQRITNPTPKPTAPRPTPKPATAAPTPTSAPTRR